MYHKPDLNEKYKSIFNAEDSNELIDRIEKLNAASQPLWGKMSVSKMFAHCNVSYEMAFEDKHPKPNTFKKFILTLFVKKLVVSDKPYSKNGQTAPEFIIKDDKNFESEKNRLISYIKKTQELGPGYFDKKASHSFGILTIDEWNNMFYKHLDHHLNQFGVCESNNKKIKA